MSPGTSCRSTYPASTRCIRSRPDFEKPAMLSSSNLRFGALAHQGEDVVEGDGFGVLVGDLGVPADFAIAVGRAQRFFLAGEAHLDAITRLDGLYEAQVVEAVVGQHRAIRWIDEQARSSGNQEVSVCHAAAEQR